ncbi:MAG: hypothetical protein L6Q99_01695 [Planctomycetes bacterium]|nr:hypothetical protein [Planctomycetota bacterium]
MSPHQLQFDLRPPQLASSNDGVTRRPWLRRLREEWPAWVALTVLVHVVALGLVPALVEHARLAGEEEELFAREQTDLARHEALRLELRAQNDPIYQERERRLLRTPQNPLEPAE